MNKKYLLLVIALAAILFTFDKRASFAEGAEQILRVCQREQVARSESCYAKKFRELSESKGPEEAFAVLSDLQKLDTKFQSCHLIAHGIGSGAYKRDPDAWQTLINTVDSSCSYGAIHGVIEHYVATLRTGLTRETVPTLCGLNPRFDCNHIVGHLVLAETQANLEDAIKMCNIFLDKVQEDLCLTGVFMEYQTARNLIAHGLVPESWANLPQRLPELEAICRAFQGREGIACWQEIVHAAAEKFNYQANEIYNLCATAQAPEGRGRCSRHAIAVIAAHQNFKLANLGNICIPQKTDSSFQNDCYIHIVDTTLSNLPEQTEEVAAFCGKLEEKFRQTCYNQIKNNLSVKFHE